MDIPAPIAKALYSPETLGKIKAIGERYKLHLDVIADLEAFVNLRIADRISDDALKTDVRTIVGESTLADKILSDINDSIFIPLKEALKAPSPAPPPPLSQPPKNIEGAQTPTLIAEPGLPVITAETLKSATPIVEQKMGTMSVPQKPTAPPPSPPRQYKGTDPYREPLQ